MLKGLKEKITAIKKVACIEVHTKPDGSTVYHVAIIALEKSLVKPLLIKSDIQDKNFLKAEIPEDVPVVLVLTGKGVLMRELASGMDKDTFIKQSFSSAKPEDFICSVQESQKSYAYITRQDKAITVVGEMSALGYTVVHAIAGAEPLASILPFLGDDEVVEASGYRFHIEQGKCTAVLALSTEIENKNYKIGEETIPGKCLLAFAAGFQSMVSGFYPELEVCKVNTQNYRDKKLFKATGISALALLAFVVFTNLGFFFYYTDQNQNLSSQNSSALSEVKRVSEVELELKEKEKFLNEAGWGTSSKASYYSDQIASTVPVTIGLTQLNVNPLNTDESKKNKQLIFNTSEIIITGTCKDPVVLNPWIRQLKEFKWVEKAESRNYQFDHKNNLGYFEIALQVNGQF